MTAASWSVVEGDCVEVLAGMPAASVDSIVTDPPYGLEFMGREWDRLSGARIRQPSARDREPGVVHNATTSLVARNAPEAYVAGPRMQAFHEAWAREALRVLKPGGFLLAFGGTRTCHRLTCGIEDAGFEVRDQIAWLYGSGFPKSLDVSKAIDKAAGAKREVIGRKPDPRYKLPRSRPVFAPERRGWDDGTTAGTGTDAAGDLTAPATSDAERWQGWGTALKPAHEPVVVARKPLAGSVAGNVLAHGTGGLNIDGCRIRYVGEADVWKPEHHRQSAKGDGYNGVNTGVEAEPSPAGRWPANVALDPVAAAMLDQQTGTLTSGSEAAGGHRRNEPPGHGVYGNGRGLWRDEGDAGSLYGDSGGASRFLYVAKASTAERNAMDLSLLPRARSSRKRWQQDTADRWRDRARNRHPTVKPIAFMRWLTRLVTPPGGLVLDPFAGSGSGGCAAMLEGFRWIGVERERPSVITARARLAWWERHPDGMELIERLQAERDARDLVDAGQAALF